MSITQPLCVGKGVSILLCVGQSQKFYARSANESLYGALSPLSSWLTLHCPQIYAQSPLYVSFLWCIFTSRPRQEYHFSLPWLFLSLFRPLCPDPLSVLRELSGRQVHTSSVYICKCLQVRGPVPLSASLYHIPSRQYLT